MYLIDDSYSITSGKRRLKSAFLKMLDYHKRKKTPHVYVAALKQGGDKLPLTIKPRRRSKVMMKPGNPLFRFRELSSLSPRKVNNALDTLTGKRRYEYLYPGIDEARMMIEAFCRKPANQLPCQRKVIVILSDGDPGLAHEKDFGDPKHKLPYALLDEVKRAGIELHTLCMGKSCDSEIARSSIYFRHYGNWRCGSAYYPKRICTGYCGGDIMRELATYTGGKFYGQYRP